MGITVVVDRESGRTGYELAEEDELGHGFSIYRIVSCSLPHRLDTYKS
jgi:hypothetical protein